MLAKTTVAIPSNIKKSFIVYIDGTWDGKTLILKEDFIYDDGSKEFREWTITKEGENFYTGFADGVIGKASGSTSGNAFNWKYTFDLPIGSKKIKVNFDDWMSPVLQYLIFLKVFLVSQPQREVF